MAYWRRLIKTLTNEQFLMQVEHCPKPNASIFLLNGNVPPSDIVKYFRPYVHGRHFTISTDHNPLRWLQSVKDSCDRLLRWSLKLQQYDFTVAHRPGRAHRNADVVSRIKHKTIATLQFDTSTSCTSSDACDKNLDFRRITAAVTTATMDKVRDQQLTDP